MFLCSKSIGQERQSKRTDSTETKKVVFIIVDGISLDMLEKASTPNLDAMAKVGAFSRAYVGGEKGGYSETPTISAVGYNSLLTGTWVNKHNVFGNSIKDPNYNYPTIYRLFENQYPDKKTAIFSTWLDNRTKLIGEGLPETDNIKVDYAFDGFELDTINFPHDAEDHYIKRIDKKVATEAARYITEEAPDLSWVYLQYTDGIGHRYGYSPQMDNAIKYEDSLVGKIWTAVQKRQKNYQEDWLIIVTTDHGRNKKGGKGHGGQSAGERSTWIVTNAQNTNSYFKNQIPSIVDILPTMISFLNIDIAKDVQYELDGVSLIDPVDAIDLGAYIKNNRLHITWKNLSSDKKKAKLYYTVTNNFKTGGRDNYKLLGEVSLSSQKFTAQLPEHFSSFYKIVLVSPNITLNTWITN